MIVTYDFPGAVDRTAIEPFALIRRVLNLQAGFDMFHRRSHEAHRYPSHDTCNGMAESGKLVGQFLASICDLIDLRRCDDAQGGPRIEVLKEKTAVKGQGTKHPFLVVSQIADQTRAIPTPSP